MGPLSTAGVESITCQKTKTCGSTLARNKPVKLHGRCNMDPREPNTHQTYQQKLNGWACVCVGECGQNTTTLQAPQLEILNKVRNMETFRIPCDCHVHTLPDWWNSSRELVAMIRRVHAPENWKKRRCVTNAHNMLYLGHLKENETSLLPEEASASQTSSMSQPKAYFQ